VRINLAKSLGDRAQKIQMQPARCVLEELSRSAQIPGGVTYGELKLYPQWDSLRGDPRFEKIVAALTNPKS